MTDDTGDAPPGLRIPPKPPLPPAGRPEITLPPGWTVARAAPTPRRAQRRGLDRRSWARLRRDPRVWLVAYVVLLAGIAFWPVPVDSGAGPLLRLITRTIPLLTYDRVEFGANILLFVPLGLLLALIFPGRRHLVVPAALITSVVIESTQGVLLGARTASLLDVVANTTGACVGLVLAEVVPRWRHRERTDLPR